MSYTDVCDAAVMHNQPNWSGSCLGVVAEEALIVEDIDKDALQDNIVHVVETVKTVEETEKNDNKKAKRKEGN
jgi:hypothetical protein